MQKKWSRSTDKAKAMMKAASDKLTHYLANTDLNLE